jgi:hypothetical protein
VKVNKLWLRFIPILLVLLINLFWLFGWIGQQAWFYGLVIAFGLHLFLSIRFFKYRREIFSANRLEAQRKREAADANTE